MSTMSVTCIGVTRRIPAGPSRASVLHGNRYMRANKARSREQHACKRARGSLCQHSGGHRSLLGRSPTGEFNSVASAVYPPGLATAFAAAVGSTTARWVRPAAPWPFI